MTAAAEGSAAPRRPNVILILADDLGWSDVGCFGAEISTPNIDRLASDGRRFTQMYNNCRCSPTRASLLTGLYPTQTGIGLMTQSQGTPEYQGYLNRRCVTLAEALGPAGYKTSISGKWHVAGNRQQRAWPHARGFDEAYCGLGGNGYFTIEQYRNGELIGISDDPDFHLTDSTTDHAVETISRFCAGDQPFFSYVAYNAPHFPLHAREEDIAPYRGQYLKGWESVRRSRYEAGIAKGVLDPAWALPDPDPNAETWPGGQDPIWQDARMAAYAAQVTQMDRGIGQIMDCLSANNVRDNTLVFFLSDNGACSKELETRGAQQIPTRNDKPMKVGNRPDVLPGPSDTWQSYGLSWANASNSPFRRFKKWCEEGGIATPFIASWPAAIEPDGLDTRSVLHVMDFMPTLLELAGAEYPRQFNERTIRRVQGESFADLLVTSAAVRRKRSKPLFWEHLGHRAARFGPWKIVAEEPTGDDWSLFDMRVDRTETVDVAADHPKTVGRLSRQWDRWKGRVGVRTYLKWEEGRKAGYEV